MTKESPSAPHHYSLHRRGLAQMSRWCLVTAKHHLNITYLNKIPMGCHRLCYWEGADNLISCLCQNWSQVFFLNMLLLFFWICFLLQLCLWRREGQSFSPVLSSDYHCLKNCWCFVLFSLSRWAEEGSRRIWHRHGRARDRAGGCGNTVPVQKIPEEKSGVPVLVATSQLKT